MRSLTSRPLLIRGPPFLSPLCPWRCSCWRNWLCVCGGSGAWILPIVLLCCGSVTRWWGLELAGSGLVFGDISGLICDVGSSGEQCLDPLIQRRWQDGGFTFLPKHKFYWKWRVKAHVLLLPQLLLRCPVAASCVVLPDLSLGIRKLDAM